ncbi:hypothetical protein Tco_0183530 [Tanacetum coccineum]
MRREVVHAARAVGDVTYYETLGGVGESADLERGPLLSFEELVNDNTSNACKQQKICNNVASCVTVLPTESDELREMRAEYEILLLQFGQLVGKVHTALVSVEAWRIACYSIVKEYLKLSLSGWNLYVVDDQRMVIKLYIVQDFKRDQLCSCHLSGLEYLERGEPRAISPLQD